MAVLPTNDNDALLPIVETDAQGQAAILLIESLIHGLIEDSIISVARAVEIVGVATDVQRGILTDRGEGPAATSRSIASLEAISHSLSFDLPPE